MAFKLLTSIFGSRNDRMLKTYRKTVAQINALESALESLSDEALRAKTDAFKARLQQGEDMDETVSDVWM